MISIYISSIFGCHKPVPLNGTKKGKVLNLRHIQNSIINQILLGDEGAQRRAIFIYFSTLFYRAKILLECISRRGCWLRES